MTTRRAALVRRRLQGLAMLVVLVLLFWATVLQYQHAFSTVARVTLRTDTVGNQLQPASDVKVRGVIVGEVRQVDASLRGATIDLAIDPQYLDQIPANVTARLLPKTLFGERYVSLVEPENPSPERLHAGQVIGQDRTKNAIELQKVIDDMLPLLQAVQPQDLAYTLGAMANALRGHGTALGENLVNTGQYISEINTVLPQLEADIGKMADFADTYQAASQDLLAVLDNLSVTNKTIVDQREQLRRTFTVVGSSSNTFAGWLETNEQNLIQLASTSRPVLGMFAKYSPIYPCLLNGLARYVPIDSASWTQNGHPALKLNIVVSFPPRNSYKPGDQPQYAATNGPDCRGLTNIDGIIAAAQQGTYYCPLNPAPDGVHSDESAAASKPRCMGGGTPSGASSGGSGGGQSLTSPVGSSAELDFVRSLLGYQTGVSPGSVSDLSAATLAPLLRGTQVVLP
jgi:virulence factor Mce-like protein